MQRCPARLNYGRAIGGTRAGVRFPPPAVTMGATMEPGRAFRLLTR